MKGEHFNHQSSPAAFCSFWIFYSKVSFLLFARPASWFRLRACLRGPVERLFDIVLACYHIAGIKCPYWFVPDWSNLEQDRLHRRDILWSEIGGLFQQATLNHHLSQGTKQRQFMNFFLVVSLETLLSPSNVLLPLSPTAYQQKPPNNPHWTLKSFPGPLNQTELCHSGCWWSGGYWGKSTIV